MKAITIAEPGGPDVLRITEVPTPDPGRHQVQERTASVQIQIRFTAATTESRLPGYLELEL